MKSSYGSAISQSEEYKSFRGSIPLKNITVAPNETWTVYDTGSRSSGTSPLLCLPPISGTADIFFKQCLALSARGYRVISVSWPVYWTHETWCQGLSRLLDHLGLERVHIFGAALGGFLGQKYAEMTRDCPRVASLILCNTFTDTSVFNYKEEASSLWLLPPLVLRRMIMSGLQVGNMDSQIMEATDFILERLDSLGQSELSSRLTLNCVEGYIKPQSINDLPVTIIDVFDDCSLQQNVRDETYKCYPTAKLAHLKSGGNFPYLSRSDEVNLHLAIHMRNFESAVA